MDVDRMSFDDAISLQVWRKFELSVGEIQNS